MSVKKMGCRFCEIVKNTSSEEIIFENDKFLIFPALKALLPGHILIIPKKHTEFLFEMGEKDYTELMALARKISFPLKKAFQSKTVGILLNGLEVPHAHLHLLPRSKFGEIDDLKSTTLSKAELKETADKIRKAIKDAGL